MNPQTTTIEEQSMELPQDEEPFVRQVEDHSLPAQQVLTDQEDCGERPLFVP